MEYSGKIAGFFGDYRWLSNFWMVPLTFWMAGHKEIVFPSAEHAYQAAKSEDPKDWERMSHIPTPGAAKKAGRLIKMRPGWDDMKVSAMREILQTKFRDDDLRAKLLATGDAELIEENNWGDSFWGNDPKRKKGVNALGLLLMQERANLRDQQELADSYNEEIDRRYQQWLNIPF